VKLYIKQVNESTKISHAAVVRISERLAPPPRSAFRQVALLLFQAKLILARSGDDDARELGRGLQSFIASAEAIDTRRCRECTPF
jgi:hypothetical protein